MTKDTKCDAFGELYIYSACLGDTHSTMNDLLGNLSDLAHEDDHFGGGHYIPFGWAFLGQTKQSKGRPFTLRTHDYAETKGIIRIVGRILEKTSSVVLKSSSLFSIKTIKSC